MKKILISVSNKKKAAKIEKNLEILKNKINVLVELNLTYLQFSNIIDKERPEIVVTDDIGANHSAIDTINLIQSDFSVFQPYFIIIGNSSMYSLLNEKHISAFVVDNPAKLEFVQYVNQLLNDSDTTGYVKNYNYSDVNLSYVSDLVDENCHSYMFDNQYKKIQHEISDILEITENWPKRYKETFKNYEMLIDKTFKFHMCFLYQYLNSGK